MIQIEGDLVSLSISPLLNLKFQPKSAVSGIDKIAVFSTLNEKKVRKSLKQFFKNQGKTSQRDIPIDEENDLEVAEVSRRAKLTFGCYVENLKKANNLTPICFSESPQNTICTAIIPVIKPKPEYHQHTPLYARSKELTEAVDELLEETINEETKDTLQEEIIAEISKVELAKLIQEEVKEIIKEEIEDEKLIRLRIKTNLIQQNIFSILVYYVCFVLACIVIELIRE
ncbi:hypothetical protein [Parashewanella curva]|uniref:hypothetical protein n=1 Tax=Parashewanella curva TaxID=2338552 RepID=UPI00105977E3|nr:hypothetical protein [Parashewanella curva]